MVASTCQDETYTLTPGSEQMITHTYSNHDDCTWTVNVAMGYEQVSIIPSLTDTNAVVKILLNMNR